MIYKCLCTYMCFAYFKCSVVPLESKIQHNTSMCRFWLESARVV